MTESAHSGAGSRLVDRIKALKVAGAILHLGSHPDDEDGGMIAFASRHLGARTVYWSATRGEGGQNRRGPERGEGLGIIRTWESLDARSVDGGEVRYGPFYDFGFSKSGDDTLARWGRELVVAEIVRVIRMVQPQVIISRWSGGPTDGHGHHQAIGLVAREAFDAAGDPDQFPGLGLPPWRPAKLYRSVAGDWQPGEDGAFGVIVDEYERAGHLRVDTGMIDPVSGLTYQEQAHLAVNRHRSQGIGFVPEPGPYYFYYRLEHSAVAPSAGPENSFFDGCDPLLTGLATGPRPGDDDLRERLGRVVGLVDEASESFRPDRPSEAVPALLAALAVLRSARREVASLPDDRVAAVDAALARKQQDFEDLIASCSRLRAECLVDRPRITPGRDIAVTVRVWNGDGKPVTVEDASLDVPPGWTVRPVDASPAGTTPTAAVPYEATYVVSIPAQEAPYPPYWLQEAREPYRYRWPAASPALTHPHNLPLVTAAIGVRCGDQLLTLRPAAINRSAFPGGSRELPLTVLPPLALAPRSRREILPVSDQDTALELDVTVRCVEDGGADATLSIDAPAGWDVQPPVVDLSFAAGGETRGVRFRVAVPANADPGGYRLGYDLTSDGRPCGFELNPIRLGEAGSAGVVDENTCLAEAHLVSPAVVDVDLIDATFVRTLRYGYLRGVDEQILPALARFDLDITELEDDQLEYGDLSRFDAIVVGPNAYHSRPALRQHAARVLEYVSQGGTLVVQYQAYGYDAPGLAPWPFTYHQPHDRVTDPRAPVTLVDPDHPVLNFPNRIGPDDFDGWVHDRGLYFFGEWDRRYVPVLASHDAGEDPRAGGLLTTVYGRGTYVYAGLSFFRQIPAGVPGAVRLFANVLGLAEVRVRERMSRLQGVDLFGFMTEPELYQAARIVSERWVDAGTFLARQGERGRHLFVLVDGSVEVLKQVDGKDDRLLHVAGPGEALGELTLLADVPRSASLRAATDAVVLVLRDDAFHEWLRLHPDLSRRVMQRLAEKIIAKDQDG